MEGWNPSLNLICSVRFSDDEAVVPGTGQFLALKTFNQTLQAFLRTFHKSLRNMRLHLPIPSAACTPDSDSSVPSLPSFQSSIALKYFDNILARVARSRDSRWKRPSLLLLQAA